MNVFIFLNGDPSNSSFYGNHCTHTKVKGDRIVCADGGYVIAQKAGMKPDLIIGDLDSLGSQHIRGNIRVLKYPAEKDFSDFELTMNHVKSMFPEKIYVYGAIGGRFDHELTNVLLLADSEIPMIFVEKMVEIYNVRGPLVLRGRKGCICSLIALHGACRIREMTGFRYTLKEEDLNPSSRGLSNIIENDAASLVVEKGNVIVVINTQ